MQDRHIIIIGAGPGGLAAAMLLAQAGLRVSLVERLGRVGGRTSTLHRGNGFRFDQGPTFFLYPRVLKEIFAATGHDLMREAPMVRLDPQYTLRFEGQGELRCTPDIERMKQQIAQLCPDDARSLEPFLGENRHKLARFRSILESPFTHLSQLMSPELIRMLPLVRPWRSVDADLKRFFGDPRVRLAFSFQSKYLGMSPLKCPSLFTILSFLEYEYGVWHPIGGCGAVSQAMARVARSMGVDVRLNEPVRRMLFEGRRCVGVATDAGEIRADAVVVNADFAHAMGHLVPDEIRRRWKDRKIAKKRFSCSTYMMYLGIDGLYRDHDHHTVFLGRDYKEVLKDIETRHRLPENPAVYVQNACVTDPSLAPAGKSTLYVLVPVTHQHPNVDWAQQKAAFRETTLNQLEQKMGFAGLRDRIEFEEICTPADWQNGMNIYKGATFNLTHNLMQMLNFRPNNRFEDLDGVYLVGGGTHPGSGLPVIYESARITSRLLLGDLGLPTGWIDQAAEPKAEPARDPASPRPTLVSAAP